MTAGGVKCWGNNGDGAFGNGSSDNAPAPVDAFPTTSPVAISAGYVTACVLESDGGLSCSGNNSYGQLGNGNTQSTNAPASVVFP